MTIVIILPTQGPCVVRIGLSMTAYRTEAEMAFFPVRLVGISRVGMVLAFLIAAVQAALRVDIPGIRP